MARTATVTAVTVQAATAHHDASHANSSASDSTVIKRSIASTPENVNERIAKVMILYNPILSLITYIYI